MKVARVIGRLVLPVVILLGWGAVRAVQPTKIDFESCATELDRLRRASASAHDAASEASDDVDEVESTESSMGSRCSAYGSSDYLCESARRSHRDAGNDLQNSAAAFASEYETVFSRVRSVQSACGIPTPIPSIPGVHEHRQGLCRAVQNLRQMFGPAPLSAELRQKLCTGLTETECATCTAFRPRQQ